MRDRWNAWRCRHGWHARNQTGWSGLADLNAVHQCPNCGTTWKERITP